MKKNPFALLGIDPEALRALPDYEIRILVAGAQTALSRIFHPDVNKQPSAEARFREVQQAGADLEVEELFQEHKRHYLRLTAKGKEVVDLKAEGQAHLVETAQLEEALQGFLGNMAVPGALPPFVEETPRPSAPTFQLPTCRLLFSRSGTTTRPGVTGAWGEFELEISPDGSVSHFAVEKSFFYPKDGPPKDTPRQWVHHRPGERQQKSPFWRRHRDSPRRPLAIRLIASVDRRRLPEGAPNSLSRPGCLPTPGGLSLDDPTPGGYTWDDIAPSARYFKPFVIPFCWVVGTRMVESQPRFWLLGILHAIAPIGPAP